MATNLPRMARRVPVLLFLGLCGIAGTLMAQGQLPRLLSYQGVLSDSKRTAVPDGVYSITFRIYDAETGGTALWKEIDNVQTVDGIFETILGSNTPIDLPFDKAYWIAIELQGEPEMAPRVRFVAAPYAMRSIESESSLRLDPNAPGVVHSINALDGDLVLIGEGEAGIRMSGDTLAVVVPRALPQGAKDGQVVRWNATAGQWEAADPAVAVTPRLSGSGSAGAPLDIARMGAANGQPLVWDDAQGAWRPGAAGVAVAPPLRGDGTATAPLGLLDGDSDRQVLMWDAAAKGWKPAAQRVVAAVEIAGNGTSGDPLRLAAQGALNGQVLRWDSVSHAWHPGVPVSIATPPLSGTGTPADPLRVTDGTVAGQIMMWTGTRWDMTTARKPLQGETLRWNAASGVWEPAGITVTNTAPLAPGAIWYGGAGSIATELGIGLPNQVMVVAPGGTGPAWSSNLTIDTVRARSASVIGDVVVGGDLTVSGGTSLKGTLTTDGIATFNNDLVANDSTAFNGPVRFARFPELGLQKNAVIVGDATDHATVYPSTNISGAVLQQDAGGAPVWLRKIDVDSVAALGLRTSGNAAIGGDAAIGGGLTVTGGTSLQGDLTADGNATFNKDLIANDSAAFNGPVRFARFPELGLQRNAVIVGDATDHATIYPSTNVSGAVLQQDAGGAPVWLRKITVDSVTALGLRTSGDAAIGGGLTVAGGTSLQGSLTTTGIATFNNDLVANDSAAFNGPVRFDRFPEMGLQRNAVIVGDATDHATVYPTTNVSGAVLQQDAGGAPIWLRKIDVDSVTALGLRTSGNAAIGGDATIGGGLTVTGGTSLQGSLTTTGIATFNNDLIANDSAAFNGPVRFDRFPEMGLQRNAMIVGDATDHATVYPTTNVSGAVLQQDAGGAPVWLRKITVDSVTALGLRTSGDAAIGGNLAVNGTTVDLPAGSVDNTELANSSITMAYGSGVSGDASVSLGGTLNISNTGVTSITGTPRQVIADQSTGDVTLSLPQDIHTDATPTFDGLTLDNLSNSSLSDTLLVSNGGQVQSRTAGSLIPIFAPILATQVWTTTGNAGTTPGTNYLGTSDNQPFQIHVDQSHTNSADGRGRVMRYEPNGTSANIIGGYQGNSVAAGVTGGTISGGGQNGEINSIASGSNKTTIAGGSDNTVQGNSLASTISGGTNNTVQGNSSASTISGGYSNTIQGGSSTIGGGGNNAVQGTSSTISGGFSNSISSVTSVISGGDNATIGANARWSMIGGGHNNKIFDNSYESTIGAGEGNQVNAGSMRGTVGGGSFNIISTNASNATISGGYGNNIRENADRTTIGGGMSNTISPAATIATIGGGFQNTVDTNATGGTVGGGQNNRNASGISVIAGGDGNYITSGSLRSVIGGGYHNLIATSSGTSTIAGGENDTIRNGSLWATIGGGGNNDVGSNAAQATIGGGINNRIGDGARGATVGGGSDNTVDDNAWYSAIAGGRGLTLSGAGSLGFLGNNANGTRNMTVSDNDVAVFGNTDIWLASNDNAPSQLKFFSNHNAAGNYPNGTHYVAMQAPSGLAADISYILPDTAGIVGDILQVKSVSGSTLSLDWGTAGGGSIDWSITGNTGTTPGTNFIGTNDDQAFEVHIGNAVSTGNDGRGRVMRYEPNATSANIIGGYHVNSIAAGVVGGTIAGGGSNGSANSIASTYGSIGGGRGNVIGASSINGTISGGVSNSITASAGNGTISGGLGNVITSGDHATIGGGFNNRINSGSFGVMIGGGTNNQVSSHTSVVGGGNGNNISTSSQFSTIAGGMQNMIGSSAFESVIIGGSIDTIETTSPYSSITGGTSNAIRSNSTRSTIGGGYDNEIGAGSDRSTIGGGMQNRINAGAYRTTISGGMQNVIDVNGRWGTIGGGEQNYIDGLSSTIGGGTHDTIESSAQNGFIGGGDLNAIRSSARYAVVAGGRTNQVLTGADYGAIGGGVSNVVSGSRSAIAGGEGLTLGGTGSFGFLGGNIGANDMTVNTNNTAVFGNTDLWLANNDNGSSQIRFYEANAATGVFPNGANYTSFQAQAQAADVEYLLPAAAGVVGDQLTISGVAGTQVTLGWAAPSDRRIKTDFLTLEGESILQKFRGVDLGTWRYTADPSGRRHYGIMAQDFKKLFGNDGLGEISTDTTVNNIDMMGVSYLAIQGLEKRTSEDHAKIDEMGATIRELKEELDALRRENQTLRQQVR